MAAAPTNAQTLAALEKQYADHKGEFEKWKAENSRQVGTDSYNQYVDQFVLWEKEVLKSINKLTAEAGMVAGPANVDSILMELLDNVKPVEFVTAMMTMHMKEPSFMQNMLSTLNRIKHADTAEPRLVIPPAVTPIAAYRSNVAPPAYAYHSPAVAPVQQVSTIPTWNTPTIQKPYRPPSPVRDYRNPTSSMPFRDFSQ